METWSLVKFLSSMQTHKHLQEIICTAVDIISSAAQMSSFMQSVLGSAASLTGCVSPFSCNLLSPVVRFQDFASSILLKLKVCMLLEGLAIPTAFRSSLLFGEN